MCIFRLGFLLDRKKYFTDDTSCKKGLDVDGDIFNIYHKNRYGKMVSKTFFVNIMHVYGDEVLEINEYYRSFGFIQEKDLRTKMHKYYMKETLSSMLNKDKEK